MEARLVLIFAVISFAPVFVPTQNHPAAAKGQRDAQQTSPAASVSINCNCTDQAKSRNDQPQGWHKLVTWPEGIATWALIFTLAAIIWQAVETRRAVGASANSQRSWLLAEGVDKPDLQQVWINKATLNFKVIGNSPLRIMEGKLIYTVIGSRPDKPKVFYKKPDLPERPAYGEPLNLADSPSMGRIHAPGDPVTVEIPLESLFLKPENVKALEDGESFLCVYGFVRYRDSFISWKRRETRFCFACGNWGPTSPKASAGYVVAGPAAYNDVLEIEYLMWRRLWSKAMRAYRNRKHRSQNPNSV
jgi:hypothetical protein